MLSFGSSDWRSWGSFLEKGINPRQSDRSVADMTSGLCCVVGWMIYGASLCACVQIDENVQREIINHRALRHPNIIRFKEVIRKS